jgi:hypothetical protein
MNGIGPGGVTADQRRWEKEAQDLQHAGLAKARESAAGWEKSIAGLLGVFSIVAFIKGPQALSDLNDSAAVAVAILVLVAATLAIAATVCAAVAAQGVPTWLDRLDGSALRKSTRDASHTVIVLLWVSRGLALGAAICVLAGMTVAWLSSTTRTAKASPQRFVVVNSEGGVSCGILELARGAVSVSPDGKAPGIPVGMVRQIVPVSSCPK